MATFVALHGATYHVTVEIYHRHLYPSVMIQVLKLLST